METLAQYINPSVISHYAMQYGAALIGAIAVFVIGKWLAKLLTKLARRVMNKADIDETISSFLGNIIYGILFAFVIIAALSQLGVETTSLAAIFAAAGLAIGLALQGSLSNFAAGILLIAFRPFKAGDFIEAAGVIGTVEEVSIFTTTIKTTDNKTVIIPNGNVSGDSITNYSTQKTRRVDMVFGIGYDDDIKKAKSVLADILAKDSRVLKNPEPKIGVLELADSSVNFAVRPWVKSGDYWDVFFATHEEVKLRFDAEGISIPFPQQDVHMHQAMQGDTAA